MKFLKKIKYIFVSTLGFISLLASAAKAHAETKPFGDLMKMLDGTNPNFSFEKFTAVIYATIDLILDLTGGIAVIMILYSAFLYVTTFGEESKAENAKKTLTWSIVGVFIIVAAKIIVTILNKEVKGG